MKMKKLLTLIALCALTAITITAQNSKTTSKMLYHNGPVLHGPQNEYVIWYGCWTDNCGLAGDTKTIDVVNGFMATIGNTPYMNINSTYPDGVGPASSGLVYAGSVFDSSYAHGVELTDVDIQGIVLDQILNFRVPQDPQGIYIVIASADIASNATGFCSPGAPPYHSSAIINGGQTRYIFLGNPNRCPTVAGPQFSGTGVPTPHNSFAGDVLASNFAHALNTTLTNPNGTAWFDRYGLQNADKCVDAFGQPTFGPTYLTANGARANIRLGVSGDYLIQQNWVNDRKARCAMSQ
jgi:hypothetical protein